MLIELCETRERHDVTLCLENQFVSVSLFERYPFTS
ncbi:MAG: hypothetical protein JWN43_4844, partial [Gammaproteobacteria bacterium]|nr:hypothetical protein [Gammaproteobacteria bacterium]